MCLWGEGAEVGGPWQTSPGGEEEVKRHCSQERTFCCIHKGIHPKRLRSQWHWPSRAARWRMASTAALWQLPKYHLAYTYWESMEKHERLAIMVGYLFWYRKMWSFWIWLISLNPVNPSTIHFSADVRILFFTVKYNSTVAHFLYLLICW